MLKRVNVTILLKRSIPSWAWPLVSTISTGRCLTPIVLQTLDFLWTLVLLLTALDRRLLPLHRLQAVGSLSGVKSQWWLMLSSCPMLPPFWSRRRRMELILSPSDFVINWVIQVQYFLLYCMAERSSTQHHHLWNMIKVMLLNKLVTSNRQREMKEEGGGT